VGHGQIIEFIVMEYPRAATMRTSPFRLNLIGQTVAAKTIVRIWRDWGHCGTDGEQRL